MPLTRSQPPFYYKDKANPPTPHPCLPFSFSLCLCPYIHLLYPATAGEDLSPFPRKAPTIPSTCCSLPRIFQLFLSRVTVLLWRALLTRLRHCLASGALPPFPYLANTCLCFGSLVGWLVDLLIVEKAACAFPPPHCPYSAFGPQHKRFLITKTWAVASPGGYPLQPTDCSPVFSPRFPCPEWPQAPRCSLDSEHDSPQNQQLCHSEGPQLVTKPLLPVSIGDNNTCLMGLL